MDNNLVAVYSVNDVSDADIAEYINEYPELTTEQIKRVVAMVYSKGIFDGDFIASYIDQEYGFLEKVSFEEAF